MEVPSDDDRVVVELVERGGPESRRGRDGLPRGGDLLAVGYHEADRGRQGLDRRGDDERLRHPDHRTVEHGGPGIDATGGIPVVVVVAESDRVAKLERGAVGATGSVVITCPPARTSRPSTNAAQPRASDGG